MVIAVRPSQTKLRFDIISSDIYLKSKLSLSNIIFLKKFVYNNCELFVNFFICSDIKLNEDPFLKSLFNP